MAWWVVIDHLLQMNPASENLPERLRSFLGHGNWAVHIFIVVSGFVITHLLLARQDSFRSYITQRFFRLYPLYCCAMLFALIVRPFELDAWAPLGDATTGRLASEAARPALHAILHASLLHGIVPDDRLAFASSAFLPPAWSLSVEWQFYLVAPLILWAITRRTIPGYAVIGAGLAASAITIFGSFGWWRYLSFLPDALPYFFVGIASCLAIRRQASVTVICVALAGVGMAAMSANTYHASGVPLVLAIWALFCAFAIAESDDAPSWAGWARPLSRLIATNRVVTYLGRISFSTYLIHHPMLTLIVGLVTWLAGKPDATQTMILSLVAIPVIVAASALTYRFIEVPGMRLGRRLAYPISAKRRLATN